VRRNLSRRVPLDTRGIGIRLKPCNDPWTDVEGLGFAWATYQPSRARVCPAMEPKQSIWSRMFRPLPKNFRGDVLGALSVLAGAALGAWTFDAWDGFVGAIIGASLVIVFRAVRRGLKRRRAPGPLT
jgi:hypothetical protein